MKIKEKVTARRRAIVFLRLSDDGQYFPLLRVWDTQGNLLLEKDLPKTPTLDFLGDIQLSAQKVTIRPRKNVFVQQMLPIFIEYAAP